MGQWSSRYFWEMLNFKFLALFTVHLLIFSIFPYFLQGTCSKRNCAVLHTTLQIGDIWFCQWLRDNLLARPPKRVDRRRWTKCVGLKCICVVKTLSRGIICIKTSFFLFFSNFGSRETLISSPGILKDRSSSNIQCPEGSYNTQQIMNTRCFLGD